MKPILIAGAMAVTAGLLPLDAQSSPAATASQPDPDDVVLVPPKEIASNVKPHVVNGGSRGDQGDLPMIEVLTPNEVALTVQARPTLYWYQSKGSDSPCEVTLIEPKKPKPLLLLTTKSPSTAGVHAFQLSKFNVDLKPGVIYSWSVAIVINPRSRSEDVVANGVIKRIEAPADLTAKLAQTTERNRPALYARNGLFYDALQSLSDQIDKSPQDEALRKQRSKLLTQVGVKNIEFASATASTP
jgi:hypothetical protein